MHRFYLEQSLAGMAPGAAILLEGDQAHHARRTLRIAEGDDIILMDGRGWMARAACETWERDAGIFKVLEATQHPRAQPYVTLAVALPKGSRADDMVNQISQAGVDRLIPLRTRRGVSEAKANKLERFKRIAIEAMKQSGRAYVLEILEEQTLVTVLAESYEVKWRADPAGKAQPAGEVAQRLTHVNDVLVLIGPEGGWTPEEIAQARQGGCEEWWIGPHVMRIETAAVAAAGIVRYLAGK